MARLWTLAFTGRARAALGFLEEHAAAWRLSVPVANMFRASFVAIAAPSRPNRARAEALNLKAAQRGPGACVSAVNHLSAIGAYDAAFRVLDGYLLDRGPLTVASSFAKDFPAPNEMRWRKTMMLFVPVTALLRADPRFEPLVEAIGLGRTWAATGLPPDYRAA